MKMKAQYDFAFSFAGEDRALVKEIEEGLSGFKIFYDNNYQSELCGRDLYSYLRNLYMNRSKFVVCFLSKNYKKKVWTNLEFSAIKERLMATFFASDFLIPIVLDEDAVLEDLPSFIGFYKHTNIKDTIDLLKSKYNHSLNEDIYLDSIRTFRDYLLEKITSKIAAQKIHAECGKDYIRICENYNEKIFYLLPETFSNLPCLLMHEGKRNNPPSGIITWKRDRNILFLWNPFSVLTDDLPSGIAIDDLIDKMTFYFISDER